MKVCPSGSVRRLRNASASTWSLSPGLLSGCAGRARIGSKNRYEALEKNDKAVKRFFLQLQNLRDGLEPRGVIPKRLQGIDEIALLEHAFAHESAQHGHLKNRTQVLEPSCQIGGVVPFSVHAKSLSRPRRFRLSAETFKPCIPASELDRILREGLRVESRGAAPDELEAGKGGRR